MLLLLILWHMLTLQFASTPERWTPRLFPLTVSDIRLGPRQIEVATPLLLTATSETPVGPSVCRTTSDGPVAQPIMLTPLPCSLPMTEQTCEFPTLMYVFIGLTCLLHDLMVIPVCLLGTWMTPPTATSLLKTLGILRLNRCLRNRPVACERTTWGRPPPTLIDPMTVPTALFPWQKLPGTRLVPGRTSLPLLLLRTSILPPYIRQILLAMTLLIPLEHPLQRSVPLRLRTCEVRPRCSDNMVWWLNDESPTLLVHLLLTLQAGLTVPILEMVTRVPGLLIVLLLMMAWPC